MFLEQNPVEVKKTEHLKGRFEHEGGVVAVGRCGEVWAETVPFLELVSERGFVLWLKKKNTITQSHRKEGMTVCNSVGKAINTSRLRSTGHPR